MLLTKPLHSIRFLRENHLGVEAHIGRYESSPTWAQYLPFVGGVHLPYEGINLASPDEAVRTAGMRKMKDALAEGCRYGIDRMVIHTLGIRSIGEENTGDYDTLLESLRELAAYAAERSITLCMENQLMYPPKIMRLFGDTAEEWFRIRRDAGCDNLMLTLDTSHASTSLAVYPTHRERLKHLYDFLKFPEMIGRIHWSDSRITNNEAAGNDMHLCPGAGDLPLPFHSEINRLPAVKLLEQNCSSDEVLRTLEFIENLP